MTTPTNWPNPERPGYPMFPERDGWHILNGPRRDDNGNWQVSGSELDNQSEIVFWNAAESGWVFGGLILPAHELYALETSYGFQPLTPTQITEMLAGERERCAKVCEDAYEKSGRDFEYLGCNDAASQIRNLGDAP